MEKKVLRDNLFAKYFEVENGIEAIDLVNRLKFIPELWKELHHMCERNIKYFDSFSTLDIFKLVEYNNKKYLIIKLRMFRYVIIDIEKRENITEEQFNKEFNEEFFINNFNEVKSKKNRNMFSLYSLYIFDGNIEELLDFYIENKSTFDLPTWLYYRIEIGNAWTYFSIDFANASAQLGFQTPNQFLYEQLFLKYDLTASSLQDAQEKIGKERMQEMFDRIKTIQIPIEVIPPELYQQYLNHSITGNYKLEKSQK